MPRFALPIEELEGLPRVHATTIPPDYIDIMGHTNIRHYFAIFAEGARNFTSQLGITEAYVAEQRQGAFMLRHHNEYFAEVRLGEQVAVRCRLLARSEKRIHYMAFLVNETRGVVAATMEIVTTHADLTARRSSPFPPRIAATVDALLREHARLPWAAPVCGALNA